MLHLHFSNRLEALSQGLLQRLMQPGASPFEADELIVPSAAVRRHLSLALARERGVCAQVRFSYLASWLWEQVARLVPGVGRESPFEPALLTWRILAQLQTGEWSNQHPRLQPYLSQSDAVMRWELAVQLSKLFDAYITYRPDWLDQWAQGQPVAVGEGQAAADQAWQAQLWRELLRASSAQDRRPLEAFFSRLAQLSPPDARALGLPGEVHAFALWTLAPLHLRMLRALSGCCEVHVYTLNPCQEYWFDVVDPKRLRWLQARGRASHHEEGPRWLSAWGRQTQSQLQLLVQALGEDEVVDEAHFIPHGGRTLLGQMQDAMLHIQPLAPGSVKLDADDRSVEVHCCHSLVRELEVLHNRLLALFRADPSLKPGEILVLTPDLDAAAPLVEAVFGCAPPSRHIPWALTGQARTQGSAAATALLGVLDLAASRFKLSELIGLLQQPLVARRFGLQAEDVAQVRLWLEQAGVRWGLDAQQRTELGLPAQAPHTLEQGLQRLFLSYAMPEEAVSPGDPPLGLLAAGHVQGTAAAALGCLWHAVQALRELRAEVGAPRPAQQWPALLQQAVSRFLDPSAQELEEVQELRAAVDALARQFERSGFDQPVEASVVREALARELDEPARGGVPSGVVSFSAMHSLRALPYRVICLVGMDDAAFPSQARPLEFDLMPLQPRLGDRQRSLDDRNLFLDLLLAAREHLHLSYTGRSARDNAPLRASVVVEELLEDLVAAIAADPTDRESLEAARRRLVVEHPLQPFAPEAFLLQGDPRLRSHQNEYLLALRALAQQAQEAGQTPKGQATVEAQGAQALEISGAREALEAEEGVGAGEDDGANDSEEEEAAEDPFAAQDPPFFTAPLPQAGAAWQEVSLPQWLKFFGHPARFLLQQRLGLRVGREQDEWEDEEPFSLPPWERSALARRVMPAVLAATSAQQLRSRVRASASWPDGGPAEIELEAEVGHWQRFAQVLAPHLEVPTLPPHSLRLELPIDSEPWALHGALTALRPQGQVFWDFDRLRPAHALQAWLQHLLLCAARPEGVALVSTWFGREQTLRFRPCEHPLQHLQDLMRCYRQGLSEPLLFMPRTSWAWVESGGKLQEAAREWHASERRPYAEGADPAWSLALRGRADPLAQPAFRQGATRVLEPLFAHMERT